MVKPKRVQLSRKKGWRMPENTVKVSRPTKWGNPYRITEEQDPAKAVELFRRLFTDPPSRLRHLRLRIASDGRQRGEGAILDMKLSLPELRGKNLACFCRLDQPCHADVLLELANAATPGAQP